MKPPTVRRVGDSSRSSLRAVKPAGRSPAPLLAGIGAALALMAVIVAVTSGGRRRPPEETPAPRAAASKPASVPVEDPVERETARLDAELRGPLDRDDFKQALGCLGAARGRVPGAAWARVVDERERGVREAVAKAFPALRDKAVAAARAGREEEAKTLRDRAAGWGLERDIDGALAEVPKPFQQGVDGLVVIEAEHFAGKLDRGGAGWAAETKDGTEAMVVPERSRAAPKDYVREGPQLDYAVRFARAGTHYLWVRGLGPTGNADSLHAGLDGAASKELEAISVPAAWGWTSKRMDGKRAKLEVPSPGTHVLNLWMREDGTYVDRLLITPNEELVPAKAGLSESRR